MRKTLLLCLGVLQILVGVGAVVSGAMLIADPSGAPLHAPVEMLKGSPFHDFLLPGVILFLVNGVGQLGAGVLSIRLHRWSGFIGAVFGFGLMIWIFVQVSMIGGGHVLQYSYFTAGVAETALAFLVQSRG